MVHSWGIGACKGRLQSAAAGMPHCTCLESAVALLDGPGERNLEVLLSSDTRSDVGWFPALSTFRVAWQWGHRERVYVDLVGNIPACFERRSYWWHKVFISQRLLNCRRLKLLLWLDTDATISPILATFGDVIERPPQVLPLPGPPWIPGLRPGGNLWKS